MASNYPGSLDSLTNPSPTDSELTVSHSAQHTNANDAIEAIQAELGTDPAGSEATVAARLTAIEATGTGDVSGPGSSTDNALVRWDGTGGDTVQNSGVTVDDSNNVTVGGTIYQNRAGAAANSTIQINADAGYHAGVDFRSATSVKWTARLNSDGRWQVYNNTLGASAFDIAADSAITTAGNVTVGGDIELGSGGPTITTGTGDPESVVSAPVGSLYSRTDGSTSTTLYVKESGAGNTGWVAK